MHVMKQVMMHFIYTVAAFCLSASIACSFEITTETVTSNNSMPTVPPTIPEFLQGKHKSLFTCPAINLELGEYELFPNGTLHVEKYNMLLNESLYFHLNGTVTFCPFFNGTAEYKNSVYQSEYLTLIGLTISMICLFLHLVAFSFVPEMRNLPGWNLAALCLSLLLSYLLLILVSSSPLVNYRDICVALASLTHFFLLSSFLWMSIMSFDLFMSLLRTTGSLRMKNTQFRLRKFAMYSLCAFGIALVFSVLGILADVLEAVPKAYKPQFEEICWFSQRTPLIIFFGGPVIALICLNFIFFALCTYTIYINTMNTDNDSNHNTLKRNYLMYFRLSVIMGITWISGVVATIVNEDWVWYIFVFLNTLQGLFIFLAFTCSEKVKKYLLQKLISGRRGSDQTLLPTFQSYCYYTNSTEKDRD